MAAISTLNAIFSLSEERCEVSNVIWHKAGKYPSETDLELQQNIMHNCSQLGIDQCYLLLVVVLLISNQCTNQAETYFTLDLLFLLHISK